MNLLLETGRTKLTTLAMIEMLRIKRPNNLQRAKFRVWDKVLRGYPNSLKDDMQ